MWFKPLETGNKIIKHIRLLLVIYVYTVAMCVFDKYINHLEK